ncbi:MAG: dGTP triphosphohydrolase, partial [Lachnospiraceae bacterium]
MNWDQLLCKERIRSYQKSTTSRDLRTEFEKDYHRIIGSASFRRLQDKTQVFPLDKSDYVRTRLTHSLEVSSFAKSLAQNVGEKLIQEKKEEGFGLKEKEDISNILQCAGLLHDIGNPPFGHFGETTIQDWFKKNLPLLTYKGEKLSDYLEPQMLEDFYHFEGNAQALRVVTRLHFLVDENGMNLTKALLGTIIKYPVSSLEINKKSGNIKTKKMGYFYADRKNFDLIQESTGTLGNRHPLTYLLEAADDIAYKTADIEDSVEKGNITYDRLIKELEERCTKYLLLKYPFMKEDQLEEK